MTGRDLWVEAAARIGRGIAAKALWSGDACTWEVMVPDRENPGARQAVPAPADGTVYSGTAGIALFLAELYAATGEAEAARAAVGAVRHALAAGAERPTSPFGFHSGAVGIACAAARAGVLLERPELVAGAEALLAPLAGRERREGGMDVIGGAAGAIPALLRLSAVLDPELVRGMACRLGDHLLAIADRGVWGWSWGGTAGSAIRDLNGLAHGAAGMGHALLELYHATGDGRYLYAAEQAFLYERQSFDREAGNWPDFRHGELGDYLFGGRMDELRARLAAGERLPPYRVKLMSAWCHGAPGIGLTRLRAWELLRDPAYREEAEAAVRTTRASLATLGNYSLCHGIAGNCETLLYAAEALGDPALREPAERCAREGWERYGREGRPWPCGTVGAVPDPGLLLGEAGIGYFYLRLASPATPSVLLPTAEGEHGAEGRESPGYREERARHVEAYFGRTLRLLERLGVDAAPLAARAEVLPSRGESPVAAMHDALVRRAAEERDPALRERLEDAFLPDRAACRLRLLPTDRSLELVAEARRAPPEEVRWEEAELRLSPRVEVVRCEADWEEWAEGGAAPEEGPVFHLLHRPHGAVRRQRLAPLAAVVLEGVRSPATLAEVVAGVEEALGGGVPDRARLEEVVLEQLRRAYEAGLIECAVEAPVAVRQSRPPRGPQS